MNNGSVFLGSMMAGEPTDVAGFDREMKSQFANMSRQDAQLVLTNAPQDIEELIADALKRRCCNNDRNNRRAALHMHLRLKKGATVSDVPSIELADLAEMVAAKGASNAIIKRLANFYARIAKLRARIEEIRSTIAGLDLERNCGIDIASITANNKTMNHLMEAYAKNEESRREKQNENQRELDRIMGVSIHPDLTEDDLPALEMHVEHIAERGCTTQELRRLKMVETALERQLCDELIKRMDAQ